MKLFCVTLLLLVFVTVESHHEERYRHHMGRGYGWRNRGYGWRDRGYGGGYNNHRYRENRRHWRREIKSQSSPDTISCTHNSLTKLLACKGLNQILECSAVRVDNDHSSMSFKLYGICQTPIGDAKSKPELVKYSLYPKTMNQTCFNDTKIEDPIFKKTFSYSIYFSKQYTDIGFRVMQLQCWKDMINMFTNTMIKGETISIVQLIL